MWWHLDNKIDTYDFENNCFVQEVVPDDKGLIFLMYLSDVEDGGVQLVKGSHKWSRNHDCEGFDHMENDFHKEIVTFNNRPKGTFIAYDYATIHRAKPYNGGQVRTSMFGQLSPSRMPVGEPILLNTRDLNGLTKKQKEVLNFGQEPSTLNWPIGEINELCSSQKPKFDLKEKFKKFISIEINHLLSTLFSSRKSDDSVCYSGSYKSWSDAKSASKGYNQQNIFDKKIASLERTFIKRKKVRTRHNFI